MTSLEFLENITLLNGLILRLKVLVLKCSFKIGERNIKINIIYDINKYFNYPDPLHLFHIPDKQHQSTGIYKREIEDIFYHDISKLHKSHKLLPITQKVYYKEI